MKQFFLVYDVYEDKVVTKRKMFTTLKEALDFITEKEGSIISFVLAFYDKPIESL